MEFGSFWHGAGHLQVYHNCYVYAVYANAVDVNASQSADCLGVQIALQKALGQRIRELRSKRGYSQEGFADVCGVHRTFMGAIERGETNISFQNLVKVAGALEVTLSQLLSGIEKRA